jgi:hypothetical protein
VIAGIAKYFLNDFLFYTSYFPNTRTFFIDFTFSSMCEALSSNPSIAKKKNQTKKSKDFHFYLLTLQRTQLHLISSLKRLKIIEVENK